MQNTLWHQTDETLLITCSGGYIGYLGRANHVYPTVLQSTQHSSRHNALLEGIVLSRCPLGTVYTLITGMVLEDSHQCNIKWRFVVG
ncbi:hypothetical protein UPYG_G00344620 [Umbra pygmaea]|uniref:Uncharacterized protein n=1 Tax=Umbra pygmaea TaxID=75934 RepID=A0ABD0W1V3_UMBPY